MKNYFAAGAFLLASIAVAICGQFPGGTVSGHIAAAADNASASSQSPSDFALAPTPPMGWNSWDSYGTTIGEPDFKANAKVMAERLKSFGWQYVVVDMEWFVTNAVAQGNSKLSQFSLDAYGRYIPAIGRFPSSKDNAGFRPIADYVHSLGLKFGIHILQGIPKQAVDRNLPIEGSTFHAAEAADTTDSCKWNPDNYGTNFANPAAQAYYDSIARLYAGWGVDFIKVDCISSRPYKAEDIRMLSVALRKTGRPIVLSLSPGAAPVEKVAEMRKYAELFRISDDVWDLWHSTVDYPQGLGDQFARVGKWAPVVQAGHWPDADMLPLGFLGPAPGYGKARQTQLSHDEQRTLMTLWCVFRSPLMLGANLTAVNDWTASLLTNSEVLTVDQRSSESHAVMTTDKTVVWMARDEAGEPRYVAVFNVSDAPQSFAKTWKELELTGARYNLRDLWEHKDLGAAASLKVALPAHGCVLYRISL